MFIKNFKAKKLDNQFLVPFEIIKIGNKEYESRYSNKTIYFKLKMLNFSRGVNEENIN